jgi:DUF971 family protein
MTVQLTEISCNASRATLALAWADGVRAELPYALLRRRCGCAECRQLRRSGEPAAGEGTRVSGVVPYGANAVQLQFSDGHARGIFPFDFLRELAREFTTQAVEQ